MKPLQITHLSGAALAFFLAEIAKGGEISKYCQGGSLNLTSSLKQHFPSVTPRSIIVVPDTRTAESLLEDLRFFLSGVEHLETMPFLGWDVLPFEPLSPGLDISGRRLATLAQLVTDKNALLVTTPEAILQRLPAVKEFNSRLFSISKGESFARDALVSLLDSAGYVRCSLVEESGQMAVRGAVVDVFPPGLPHPIRIELFSDQIQSVRDFDTATQRSSRELSNIGITPVREFYLPDIPNALPGDSYQLPVPVKERARELEVPPRHMEGMLEAMQKGLPWPGIEQLQPLFAPQKASLFDYVGDSASVLIFQPERVLESAENFQLLLQERYSESEREARLCPRPEESYFNLQWLKQTLYERASIMISEGAKSHELTAESAAEHLGIEVSHKTNLSKNQDLADALQLSRHKEFPFKPLADEVLRSRASGLDVGIVVSQSQRLKRVTELLSTYSVHCEQFDGEFFEWRKNLAGQSKGRINLLQGHVSSGFKAPAAGFQLIHESEIFPEISSRRTTLSAKNVRRFLGTVSQLKENDFIVHIDHGVGMYRGLKQLQVEGKMGDFLSLEYAEGAKLFIPVENIAKIQKYVGAEGRKPTLTKLGGKVWATTKKKVQENVAQLAGQLVNLYAEREIAKGFSFGELDSDDAEFADAFPFEETPDQIRAISEVLADMARTRPMDRLVCGDVGYGKTEVAMRAAYKAVSAGKQVALLVPTTILAEQHFASFKERFAEFPVRIGCVSRFSSSVENKATLERLIRGELDIIIGTHRLLQKDVIFRDLGLLIIDEEHRFGVAHKEKLKNLRTEIDVLTLTATPIPRTLHMSLVGIRDLSLIATAPVDRQVIRTYLAPYENSVVREAILREHGRGGQVFYIHNRVNNIGLVRDELAALIPEVTFDIGHGQMKDTELEEVMHRFIAGKVDVLVSTTIVESGLDIPNANTIIIRNAENFGLAELYQLRGRVGRSSRRAYAYLLVSDTKTLGVDAKKRLEVLQSLDDLGVGFRLAMQDMEIRGAGNLLGKDQSGQVDLVGFELYSRVLKDAVKELQRRKAGEVTEVPDRPEVDPDVSIGFPAHIPTFYIPDVSERLILYQRMVALESEAEGREMLEEIEDRFGNPPQEVVILIELMIFRSELKRLGVVSAIYRNGGLSLAFHPQLKLPIEKVVAFAQRSPARLKLSPTMGITIRVPVEEVSTPADLLAEMREVLGSCGF